MKNHNSTHFENAFFAIKLTLTKDGFNFWEIVRKINTLPSANGELLEIIVQCLQSSLENYFFFELKDFDMCKDLSTLGGFRIGYLVDDQSSDLAIDGWGEQWHGQIKKMAEIELDSVYRKNLFQIKEIKHSLECTDNFFIETFFKRDRLFWGITQGSLKWNKENKLKIKNKTCVLDKWVDISQSRVSATHFKNEKLTQNELEELLKQSMYTRDDGHLTYGTSGGFDEIKTYLAIREVDGIASGIYKVDSKQKNIFFQKKYESFDLLEQFLFLPEEIAKASVFLFFSVSFDEIYEKYGQRAIRFSLLNLGGALQQINLAATAQGLNYRTIGGFDELQCSKILEINGQEYLACAAILGK